MATNKPRPSVNATEVPTERHKLVVSWVASNSGGSRSMAATKGPSSFSHSTIAIGVSSKNPMAIEVQPIAADQA